MVVEDRAVRSAVCRRCGHAEIRPGRFCPVCGQPLPGRVQRGEDGPLSPGRAGGKRSRTRSVGFTFGVVLMLAAIAWLAHSAARQLDQLVNRPISERQLQRRLYNQGGAPEAFREKHPPRGPR